MRYLARRLVFPGYFRNKSRESLIIYCNKHPCIIFLMVFFMRILLLKVWNAAGQIIKKDFFL